MRLCVVKYVFRVSAFFFDFYQGKMSINDISSILKLFTPEYNFHSGICYMIKHSKINSSSGDNLSFSPGDGATV